MGDGSSHVTLVWNDQKLIETGWKELLALSSLVIYSILVAKGHLIAKLFLLSHVVILNKWS